MFAARTLATRRLATRSFATVVDTAGVKVAAVDSGSPTASVTLLVKAGTRYESAPGVAHALKNFAFKATEKRSALGAIREAELYGGVLSTSLTREHLAVTAEFLKGDEEFFVDLLTSFATSSKFTRYEFEESVLPTTVMEAQAASVDPATRAIEAAHILAFRNGLGSSLFASGSSHFTEADVKAYAAKVFTKDNVAFLGTGIEQAKLSALVEKGFKSVQSGAAVRKSETKYFGGETRVEAAHVPQTIFIGFGKTGTPTGELAALAAHLSATPSVKWSKGLSPLAASLPEGASVQTVFLPYSDATLFGLLVQADNVVLAKQASEAAVQALKSAASVQPDLAKTAIAKAKFAAANAVDGRDGYISVLGPKVLEGADASVSSVVSALDKIDASAVSSAANALLKSKPTFVVVGDVNLLPYADELGL